MKIIYGQNVPAGVGQNNIIWLEANDLSGPLADGFTWADKSPNGFDATEINDGLNTPTLTTIGGQQYLRFAGLSGEQLIIPDDDGTTNLLDNSSEFSIITVFNTGATDTRAIISKRLNPSNRSWTLFHNTGFEMYGYAGNTTVGGTGSVASAGNPYISTMTVDAALSGSSVKLFVNSSSAGATGSNISIPDRSEDVYIGLFNNGDTRYFDGDIAEIIVYRDALNGGERIILENYLAQKYGVSISADYFGNDADFLASYDDDIRGIGTEDGTLKQSTSDFSSGLQISELNSTLDASNEFVIMGHDASVAHVDNIVTSLGEPEITDRWQKDYYLEFSQNGTIDNASVDMEFRFDFSEAGLTFSGSSSDYVLLFRDNTSGNFVRVFADNYSVENGDQVVVDVPFSRLGTGYYTLGRGDQLISRTWYLLQNGNWNNPSTWTLDAGVFPIPNNPMNEIPGNDDNVVVRNGKQLTIQSSTNNLEVASIIVDGVLNVGTSSGHDFNLIDGTGKIIISGNGGLSNFPDGNTVSANGFGDDANGGILVVRGSGLEFNQTETFKDVRIELDNPTDIASIGADLNINGDLTVRFGTLQFGDGTAVNRNITILGDLIVENNGTTQDGRISTAIANARHELNLYGNFENEGHVAFTQRTSPNYSSEASNGIVDFNLVNPTSDQSISLFDTTYFYRIEINKGSDATYIADFQSSNSSNFNLFGAANDNLDNDIVSTDVLSSNNNAFALINGTAKIGTNVNIPVLNNTGNYCIGSNGRLWVAGGSVTKNQGTAIVPYGVLQVSSGTLTATGNSGITLRINGLLNVSGGTVTTNNIRTSVQGPQNIGGYQQSGGTVLLDGNIGSGSASGDYYIMSLTYSGNVFIMSGGTLTVTDPNSKGAIFINSDPGNVNVTGGTVIMQPNNANDFKVTSRAEFYNVRIRAAGSSVGNVLLDSGTSGAGGNAIFLDGQPLEVVNDLIIEGHSDTDFTQYNNILGNFSATLEAVTGSTNRNDVIVGGSFIIGANSSYIGRVGTDYNYTHFNQTDATTSIENFHWGRDAGFALDLGNFRLDRTSGNELRTSSTGATNGQIRFRIRGDAEILSGTLDQGSLTIQTFGNVKNFDRLGTYFTSGSYPVAGGTPENAQVRMLPGGGETIEITDGAIFGNVQINSGFSSIIDFDGDVIIERFDFQEGMIYIGTNNLKIDDLHSIGRNNMNDTDAAASTEMFIESPAVSSFLRVVDEGRYDGATEDQRAMIITDGKVSDGGLSLLVSRNTDPVFGDFQDNYDNKTQLTFPLAFTTSPGSPDINGAGVNTYYRPAQVKVSNFVDSGYITIRPVSGELQTTDLSGGEVLQNYWNVSHSDFTNPPTVAYRFYYRNRNDAGVVDLDAGASNEASYVPGKVESSGTFLRSYESDSNTESDTDGISSGPVDADTRALIFNGDNVGTTDDDLFGFSADAPGISLENANYTAGVDTRFIGSPQIFYVRQNGNWSNNNTWSFTRGGPSAGDYPRAGDIAIIRRTSVSYSGIVTINSAEEAAVVEFDDENGFSSGCPRLIFNSTGSFAGYNSTFGEVRVAETHEGGSTPYISHGAVIQYRLNQSYSGNFPGGDFGDFNRYENALVIYGWQGASANADVTLSASATEYPIMWFEGGNLNRKIRFPDTDVRVFGKLTVPGDCIVLPNGDSKNTLTIDQELQVGHPTCCGVEGRFLFPGDAADTATVIVKGDLQVRGSDTNSRLAIDNASSNNSVHQLVVHGDITIESTGGDIDLGNGDPSESQVELELMGESSNSFDILDASGSTANFYRIKMNKGNDQSNSFTFNDVFTISDIATTGQQPIEVINGTIIFNSSIDITLADASTGDFYLPNINNDEASTGSGAIEVRQGTLRIEGDDTGLILDGTLNISGGTFDMASGAGNGNNFIEYTSSGNSEIIISNGVLDVGSQVRRNLSSTTGILQYTQTNGTFRAGVNAAPEDTRGVFEIINSGSSFTHTGGDFTIVRQNGSSTVASLIIQPDLGDLDVSGSTITIGDGSTPSGQNSIGINASVPLNNLLITGNNNLTARTYSNALSVNDFNIQTGATFNANGLDLSVNADYTNDGIFISGGNTFNSQTTNFPSGSAQNISGTGTTNFWNMTKSGSANLNVNKNITVDNQLNMLAGITSTGSNSLNVKGDVVHDATMQSDFAGPGLVFNGAELQNLGRSGVGTSSFGTITINNGSGVDIPNTGNDFRINNKVILSSGQFNIGSNLLYMENNAIFENGSGGTNRTDFSKDNMVTVNTSIVDKGIRKIYLDAYTGTFLYPVGLNFYTPVEIEVDNITASTTNTGYITVKPINGVTAGIVEDDDETCADVATTDFVDSENVLQYYWLIKSSNIVDFDGSLTMYHQDTFESIGAIAAPDYTLANYAPARLLDNTNSWDKTYSETLFDEVNNVIQFKVNTTTNYTNLSSLDIEGRYTAGITRNNADNPICGGAIPDVVPLYITVSTASNGSISDITSFATAPGGTVPSLGESPDLMVEGDFTLDLTDQFWRFRRVEIADNATLSVVGAGVNLGTVIGNGTLKLIDNSNFPAGDYDNFFPDASCSSGGGVEYEINTGSETVLTSLSNVRRVILSGNAQKVMAIGQQTNVCENVEIRDNGTFSLDDNIRLNIKGDLIKENTASFDGDYSNTQIIFDGSAIQRIDGTFTGTQSIQNMELDNANSLTIVNGNNDDVEIASSLNMNIGRIITNINNDLTILNGATITGNFANNTFVDGPLKRILQASVSDIPFPVGDNGFYLPLDVVNPSYSSGGPTKTWTTQFLNTDPTTTGLITNANDSVNFGTYNSEVNNANSRISGRELWRVDVASPAESEIRIAWNTATNVGTTQTDWEYLRVLGWNDTNEIWESYGNGNSSGDYSGFSVNFGEIVSDLTFSYSTNNITFGSLNSSATVFNALPFELISFTGDKGENGIMLSWKTANESDISKFELMKSSDLINFQAISDFDAQGNEDLNLYSFEDLNPNEGINYYKLRILNAEGEFEYSKILAIDWKTSVKDQELALKLYPNPVSQGPVFFELDGLKNTSKVQVEILDILGNRLYSSISEVNSVGFTRGSINLPNNLKSGVYIVNFYSSGEKVQGKIVVD